MKIPDESQKYTYKDWLEWEGRWELIDGKAYNMTPAPTSDHQFVVGELYFSLRSFFGNKECNVFVSPFDVFLSENEDYDHPDHVVQPDISVICDKKQIGKKGCYGAPALVVEVLSPSTALKDYNEKFTKYEQFGVKEYWIVDPTNKMVHVHALNDRYYTQRKTFGEEDVLQSFVFENLTIDLKPIFVSC